MRVLRAQSVQVTCSGQRCPEFTYVLHPFDLRGDFLGILLGNFRGSFRGSFRGKGDDALKNITIIHCRDAKDAEINFLAVFR